MAILGKNSGGTVWSNPSYTYNIFGLYVTAPADLEVISIHAYVNFQSSGSYSRRYAIYDNSRNDVSNSDSGLISTYHTSGSFWDSYTYGTRPSMTSGQNYFLSIKTCHNDIDVRYDSGSSVNGYKTNLSNNSHEPVLPTFNVSSRDHLIYIVYKSYPGLKIEGITPDKLEYTDWLDLEDVY